MLNVISHPLILHKLYLMRNKHTGTKQFRELVYETSQMIGYEAMRNLKTTLVKVDTPLTTAQVPALSSDKKLALVPILRAGLAMSEAISDLVPAAKIGHIGMYRDPVTHQAIEYFCKLPSDIDKREVFMLDPMLATASSAIAAVDQVKKHGAKHIKFLCIIACPEGINNLTSIHHDVEIFTAGVDEKLNDSCYIIPGLGDAGDRIFGTV